MPFFLHSMFRSFIAISAVVIGSLNPAPAQAFIVNARAAAESECNQRIRNGVVANNQGSFNACVRQMEQFYAPIANQPHADAFCDGVREGLAKDPEFAANPFAAQMALQMSGCM